LEESPVLFVKINSDIYRPVSNLNVKSLIVHLDDYDGDKQTMLNVGYEVIKGEAGYGNFDSPDNYYVLNESSDLSEVLNDYIEQGRTTILKKKTQNNLFGVDGSDFKINLTTAMQRFFEDTSGLTENDFYSGIFITLESGNIYRVIRNQSE
jgi:hypothetical protein